MVMRLEHRAKKWVPVFWQKAMRHEKGEAAEAG
jgi:hypothetical protein